MKKIVGTLVLIGVLGLLYDTVVVKFFSASTTSGCTVTNPCRNPGTEPPIHVKGGD